MNLAIEKIQVIFSEVLGVKSSEVTLATSMDNLPDWDSMKHLELIMGIESTFKASFEVHEILELNSVEKIINILKAKSLI